MKQSGAGEKASRRRRAFDLHSEWWTIENGAVGVEDVSPEQDVRFVGSQNRSGQHGSEIVDVNFH